MDPVGIDQTTLTTTPGIRERPRPKPDKSPYEKLVKIGARMFQLAEVAVPCALFAEILRRIERLRPRPPWSSV